MKKVFSLLFVLLLFSAVKAQDVVIESSDAVKIVYETYGLGSKEGNYDVNLYITESEYIYVLDRKAKVYTTKEGYRVTVPEDKYINIYRC